MTEQPEFEALRRRRNYVLLAVLSLLTLGVGLYPTVCTYIEQPQSFYQSYREVPQRPGDSFPALMPPSATEIHERHDRDGSAAWVRFTFHPRDLQRMTAGLRRLTPEEAQALSIVGPSFSPWWTINRNTMNKRMGKALQVYEVPAPDRGYLAIDPRTNYAFYWTVRG